MIVRDVLVVRFDGGDDVAFHNLHVIDVVQQLEIIRADLLAEFHAPGRVVALIVLVIDLGVQQFHHDDDLVLLSHRHQALNAFGAILNALLVWQAGAIAREADDVLQSGSGGLGDQVLIRGNELVVILDAVESFGDASNSIDHRIRRQGAGQALLLSGGPIVGAQ